MSTMNETSRPKRRGYRLGPRSRVALLQRPGGYAVVVVHSEGPFSYEEAEAMAAALRRTASGQLTKAETAAILGISQKGVDYLRSVGHIKTISTPGKRARVLIDADSVRRYQEKRGG